MVNFTNKNLFKVNEIYYSIFFLQNGENKSSKCYYKMVNFTNQKIYKKIINIIV